MKLLLPACTVVMAAAIASSAFAAASRPAASPFPAGPFPAGQGQAQVTAACGTCHAPTIITSKHYTEDKWGEVVDQMITRGAKVSDADYDSVVAYLARNFGVAR
jgi:mono/diheme cytochrome c family protein